MSLLRAKCPYCKTYTAVAIGPGYECHSCGREFGAGLVRTTDNFEIDEKRSKRFLISHHPKGWLKRIK